MVQVPPFGKFAKMVEEGEKFMESNKYTTGVCWRICTTVDRQNISKYTHHHNSVRIQQIWSFKRRITFE